MIDGVMNRRVDPQTFSCTMYSFDLRKLLFLALAKLELINSLELLLKAFHTLEWVELDAKSGVDPQPFSCATYRFRVSRFNFSTNKKLALIFLEDTCHALSLYGFPIQHFFFVLVTEG